MSYTDGQSEDPTKIDSITLSRLIDECKEEQEQISIIEMSEHNSDTRSMASFQQSEISMMQLAKVDRQFENINEARKMLEDIQSSRKLYQDSSVKQE